MPGSDAARAGAAHSSRTPLQGRASAAAGSGGSGITATPAVSDAGPTGVPGRSGAPSDAGDGTQPADTPAAEAGRAPGSAEQASRSALPRVALTPQMLFELLASEIALQRNEVGAAFNTQYALARQTRDPRIARRATEMALAGRSLQQALVTARLWSELDPASNEARQAHESLLLATGRLSEAEPLLQQRLQQARAQRELDLLYPQWQRFFGQVEQHQDAWRLFDRLSSPDLNVVSARIARAHVAASAADLEAATREADAALALKPDSEEAAIAAAQFRGARTGGRAGAIQTLTRHVELNPSSAGAQLALGQLLLADEQPLRARETLRRAAALKPGNPQALFTLAQAQYQAQDLDGAESTLEQYLALPPSVPHDEAPAWLFLGQISEDRGNAAQAIERLSHIDGGELYFNALARRAVLMARNGDPDGAQQLLARTQPRTPREETLIVSIRSQVYRETGRHREAYELLSQAVARQPDDADLLYDHAMAAERVDRLDVLESSLRKVIRLRPDSAHAYNALGYTLADRNVRLPEALQFIEKALSLQPEDPQIIDSLGWVQYRMRRNDSAIQSLRRAYALKPEVDIGAHLGEVLWASGRQDEARHIWREGLAREPDNRTLAETLRRLGVRL